MEVGKKYSIIYADPPWKFNNKKTGGSMKSGADAKYPTMTIQELKNLDIHSICEDNCILVMWWVGSQPKEAIELAESWGFTIKNMNGFFWRKLTVKNLLDFFGMGFWTRAGGESALIAIKGKPKAASRRVRQVGSYVNKKHSKKPDEFRVRCEELCGDGNKLEMFARQSTKGWDVFGNEVDSSIEIKRK